MNSATFAFFPTSLTFIYDYISLLQHYKKGSENMYVSIQKVILSNISNVINFECQKIVKKIEEMKMILFMASSSNILNLLH